MGLSLVRRPYPRHSAKGNIAGVALYEALFERAFERLELTGLPKSHRDGPDFLNVPRVSDLPQAVAMVAENSQIVIRQENGDGWEYPVAVGDAFGWEKKVTIKETDREN